MSSAHGAGLMLLPVFTALHAEGHAGHAVSGGLAVAALHTPAMFTVAGVVAVVVYEPAGLTVLRKASFNVNRMWAVALVAASTSTLLRAT